MASNDGMCNEAALSADLVNDSNHSYRQASGIRDEYT